jgi:hypothetical protein
MKPEDFFIYIISIIFIIFMMVINSEIHSLDKKITILEINQIKDKKCLILPN